MQHLPFFQMKLLKSLDKEGPDLEPFHKLHMAADLALRAAKKVAQGVARSMDSLVVLQCHLWLTLTEMYDTDKSPLLDALVNPQSLLSGTVGAFSEKFAKAQKQSRMMSHFLPKCADAPTA